MLLQEVTTSLGLVVLPPGVTWEAAACCRGDEGLTIRTIRLLVFPEEPSRTFLLSPPVSPVRSEGLDGSTVWCLAALSAPPFVMRTMKKKKKKKSSGTKITKKQH